MNISQIYYNCHQNASPEKNYRVDYATYRNLVNLPYYQKRVTCKVENVESEVCFCPAGLTGYLCDTFSYNKCYLNVTEPALYKGCKDK